MISKPHATDGPYWNLRGNGGMLSTLGDMHAFYTALFETDRAAQAGDAQPSLSHGRTDRTRRLGSRQLLPV